MKKSNLLLILIFLLVPLLMVGQDTLLLDADGRDGGIQEATPSAWDNSWQRTWVAYADSNEKMGVLCYDVGAYTSDVEVQYFGFQFEKYEGSFKDDGDSTFYVYYKDGYDKDVDGNPSWNVLNPYEGFVPIDTFTLTQTGSEQYIQLTGQKYSDYVSMQIANSAQACFIITRDTSVVDTTTRVSIRQGGHKNTKGKEPALAFVNDLVLAPVVSSASPTIKVGMSVNEIVVLQFNKAMVKSTVEAAISFSPAVTGVKYVWKNDSLLHIDHDAFTEFTTYTVSVANTIEGQDGTINGKNAPYIFNFGTGEENQSTSNLILSAWTKTDGVNFTNTGKLKLMNYKDGTQRVATIFADLSTVDYDVDTANLYLNYEGTHRVQSGSWPNVEIDTNYTINLWYKPNHNHAVIDSCTWEAIMQRGEDLVFIDSFDISDDLIGEYITLNNSKLKEVVEMHAGDTLCLVLSMQDTITTDDNYSIFLDDIDDANKAMLSLTGNDEPPTLLSFEPANTDTVKMNQTVKIDFSREMNIDSAEAAISIAPEVQDLVYTWSGNSLSIDHAYFNGLTDYTISVSSTARSANGINLKDTSFTFTTELDTFPPTLVSINPEDSAVNVSEKTTVKITFSETMDQALAEAAISIAPAVDDMEITWESYNAVAVISGIYRYDTKYTVMVDTSAKDLSMNNLVAGDTTIFTTAPDTIPPTITGITPSDSAVDVAMDADIVIAFSEAMKATATEGALTVDPALSNAVYTWNASMDTLTIAADDLTNETKYTVTIGVAATDTFGVALAAEFSSIFTVIHELIPPAVVSITPADGATDVAVDATFAIEFSEAMDQTATEGAISLSPAAGDLTFAWTDNTVTVTSADDLAGSTEYTLTVSKAAKDSKGNALEAVSSVKFTSEEVESVDEITITSFALYPNPASGIVHIKGVVAADIKVYDITGNLIKLLVNTDSIDVSDLSTGMYFVEVNGSLQKLLIK